MDELKKKECEIMIEKLKSIVGGSNVLFNEPMKKHTTFRIGGPATYYVTPANCEQISQILALCKAENIPYFVLGNGSNLLVSDAGYDGVVIQIYKNMNQISVDGSVITAQAGILLAQLAKKALENSLAGFEFASGIPGTLGGAVVMNAGAYGGELKDVLVSATVLTPDGEILKLSLEELCLGYRTSIVKEKEYIVLEASIKLSEGDKEAIQTRMEELKVQRVSKQPLEFPSAGSTFKRPAGYFAGKLIQDAGLRGYQVGGAQVAEKHCGFVINRGNATAADVLQLIRDVQNAVFEKFGVQLETEIKFLGHFAEEK